MLNQRYYEHKSILENLKLAMWTIRNNFVDFIDEGRTYGKDMKPYVSIVREKLLSKGEEATLKSIDLCIETLD